MTTSACGPAAMASASRAARAPPMATTPPKARKGGRVERRFVRGDQVIGHGGPARIGVLDDGRGPARAEVGGQFVDHSPGGVAVEEVEVRQGAAPVLAPCRPTSCGVPAVR